MSISQELREHVEGLARVHGFDAIGVARPDGLDTAAAHLREFVKAGYNGTMDWMATTLERRAAPTNLWPDVRSVIVLAMNYGPQSDPLDVLDQREMGAISVYARNRDYHDVIKGRLKTIAAGLLAHARRADLNGDVKVFVDTAPVMEKPLAGRSGIGWQGKHTNLVSREFGSWLFLGSIFTTLDLLPGKAEIDYCGSCRACLDICPTDAFPEPYKIDARRCISYLTIEHDGPIPEEFRKPMGNRIYGCDDCLAVCPWNKFATQASEVKLADPSAKADHSLRYFLGLDDASFRARFSGSPVKRIGVNRFLRNCLIAAGNSQSTELIQQVGELAQNADPVVAESAQWAARQLESAV